MIEVQEGKLEIPSQRGGALLLACRRMPILAIFLFIFAGVILAGLLTYDLQTALASFFIMALGVGTLANRGSLFPYMVLFLFITGNLLPMDKRFFPESSLSFNLDGFLNVMVVFSTLIVLYLNRNKLKRIKTTSLLLWGIFLGFAFLSLLLGKYPGYGLKTIFRLLAPFLIALVFMVRTDNERALRRFLTLFSLVLLIPLGLGILELLSKFSPLYSGEFRLYAQVASVFNHRAPFGMFLIVVANLSFLCALGQRAKIGYILLFVVSVLLILFNNTRIVWLSFSASFLVILFLKKRFALMVLVLMMLILAIQLFPNLQSRLGSIDLSDISGTYHSSPQLGTLRDRVHVWGSLVNYLDSLLFGNGIGFVRYIFSRHSEWFYNIAAPHNEYLGVLMDLGLVGLGLFFLFYLVLFRDLAKNSRHTRGISNDMVILSLSLVIASLVFFVTDNLLSYYTINSFYWIFFGLGLSAHAVSQEGRKPLPTSAADAGRRDPLSQPVYPS